MHGGNAGALDDEVAVKSEGRVESDVELEERLENKMKLEENATEHKGCGSAMVTCDYGETQLCIVGPLQLVARHSFGGRSPLFAASKHRLGIAFGGIIVTHRGDRQKSTSWEPSGESDVPGAIAGIQSRSARLLVEPIHARLTEVVLADKEHYLHHRFPG